MKQNLSEDFQVLDEILRKVYKYLSPYNQENEYEFLQKKDLRDRLYGKFPKCFLTIKRKGQDIPFFPICNRSGMEDSKMIQLSIKLADKLNGRDEYDKEEITAVLTRLNHLNSRFSKEIPKTDRMAAKKAHVTKMLGKINQYIDDLKGE